jgi:response regulator RpfG family c-di-GMP phosphodiesterase
LNDVEESYKITLEALVAALDAREHETQAHSQRVREYTLTLAQNLGLKYDDLTHMGRGALLHDVGKIGVRDSVLLKHGKLSEDEWIEMRKHPQIGYNILQSIEFLSPAAEIVLCHQERWDGNGYPNRLAKEDIPLGARIFAVVDTLDAMTSDRPYRKALSFKAAWNEIRECSGTQFDPRIVDAFLALPPESWIAIHDSVNRLHQNQDCFDVRPEIPPDKSSARRSPPPPYGRGGESVDVRSEMGLFSRPTNPPLFYEAETAAGVCRHHRRKKARWIYLLSR